MNSTAFAISVRKIVSLFSNILLICHEEGLLGSTYLSLDGVKLSSNASKEWSGKHSELRKKRKKLEEKVKQAVKQHREADKRADDAVSEKERRERRIKRLHQRAERIENFLQENGPKIGSRNREIKTTNKRETAALVTLIVKLEKAKILRPMDLIHPMSVRTDSSVFE